MDEPFSKLILKRNSINKHQTFFSNKKKESFNSLMNITHNKQKFAFQSYVKQYGNSVFRNSQLSSANDKKRIAKTPKNFVFKKPEKKQSIMKRAKTIQILKKCESRVTNDSFEKSEFYLGQKIDMDLISINISILATYFKSIYPDQARIKKFNDEFKDINIEGYEEILLLMKEFKDFNIFDYLSISSEKSFFLTKEKQDEINKNITKRNNIVLSLLIEHEYLKEKEDKGLLVYRNHSKMFDRTEFLLPLLENFKTILIHLNNNEISFEVEVLIFALLDYFEYAQFIYQCHINYFNTFLNKIGLDNYDFNKFLKIINNQDIDNLAKEEILIFRKIINSMAERDFFLGLDRVMTNEKMCKLANEGRLWKNIANNMEPYDTFKLWCEYKKQIDLGNIFILNKKTIDIEYNQQIKQVKDELKKFNKNPILKDEKKEEYKKLNYKLESLEKDIFLPFVFDLEALFLIFFKYNLKNVVMYFVDNLKDLDSKIFEMCLAFDEDICINILDRCLKNSNVKSAYIHLCISKKYFRLTRMLLKFQICKKELITFNNNIDLHGYLDKKNKYECFIYQEGKEDVLHFLNEKDTTNYDNSFFSIRNTIYRKNTHSPKNVKSSKTIIKTAEYMNRIFKKIFPKKNNKIKKKSTPNILTIKKKEGLFSPTSQIKNKLKFKSEIHQNKKLEQLKHLEKESNISSSNLQSSTCTLIIGDKWKKNSFFSVLNNDIKKDHPLLSNHVNTANSNYYVDNIIIEENPDSPRDKFHEKSNRVSKFSAMKINGIDFINNNNIKEKKNEEQNEMSETDLEKNNQKKRYFELHEKRNKSLRYRNIKNLSIENKLLEKRRKSFKEDSDKIIKKWKNQINHCLLNNGNNFSLVDNNNENASKNEESPILKIIYNTDGEECESSKFVIKNKSIFGLSKNMQNSISISQFEKNESIKEKESSIFKKAEKKRTSLEKNNLKETTNIKKIQLEEKNDSLDNKVKILIDTEESQNKKNRRKEKKFDFSIFDSTFQKILDGKLKINIQLIIIENLCFGHYLFDTVCLLGIMPLRQFSLEMYEKICQSLNSYNSNEESIINCSRPLLSIALAAELLNKIGNISTKMKYKADSISKSLLFLAFNIQTSINNEDTLNYYLRVQTDLSGRSALEIYAENKFYDMLEDPNVGLIIGKLWYGAEHEHKITTFLRMTRILRANSGEFYEHLIKKDYLPNNSRYTFQFCQYVQNCSERNFYESISIMIITLLYQSVVYLYVTFTKEDVTHPKTHYYYIVQIFTNILMLLSLINDILCQAFFRLTGRKGVKVDIMQIIIDFVLFIFLIFNMFDVPQKFFPAEDDPDFNILLDGIVYSILLLMAWMKVLLLLRITKIYGSFISIMLNIFWHVVNFFILFICITLLFAQCFCLYFKDTNENYKLIYDSFLTLFNTAWGQVEFTFIDLDIFGEVSLILFSTLSNIMLFNLIVGIVNNLFDLYHEKAEAESRAKIVLAHERRKWDNNYGLLILFPSPFNIFVIIFYPILLFSGDYKAKLNLFFSKFCYFFVALIIFVYIFVLGIMAYFLALFKSLFHSTYETITSTNKDISKKKHKIIFFSFFKRPFELIIYFIEDCISFWKLVFIEPQIDEDMKKQEITTFRRYIITLRKILNDYKYKEHQTKLLVKDINRKFSLFKKKNTYRFIRAETYSPQNTEALEEDKKWQKMINHTLFLQLNGQKKRKGQEYNESMSLTDGFSDNKSIQILHHKNNNKKGNKKDNLRKKSDIINSGIHQGARNSQNKQIISTNMNIMGSENDDYHYLGNISKDNSTMVLQKKITSIEAAKMQMSFHLIKSLWKIIDKFVDPEGVIDIERALRLLPDRAIYDNNFILNLEYFNVRILIRGIRKYYFSLEMDNPLFSFNKVNLMIYRLMMKIGMINHYIPELNLKKIQTELENLNDLNKFEKTAEAFQKYEEKDIMSDYDDEGKYAENENNSNPETSKIGLDSDSEQSLPYKSIVSFE